MTVTAETSAAAGTNPRPRVKILHLALAAHGACTQCVAITLSPENMFPDARVLQLSYNEARVCTTVRQAKQRVYICMLQVHSEIQSDS